MNKYLDCAEKIMYLTLIIKSLAHECGVSKEVIIEDFVDLMNEEIPENINYDGRENE